MAFLNQNKQYELRNKLDMCEDHGIILIGRCGVNSCRVRKVESGHIMEDFESRG